jgi:fibronectin-binding autotransporter adhesin
MSPRPRSMRRSRLPLKRSIRPILEDLEPRLVLSQLPITASPALPISAVPSQSTGGDTGTIVGPKPTSGTGTTTMSLDSETPLLAGEFTPQFEIYHAPGSYPAGDPIGPYGMLAYDNGNETPAVDGYGPATLRSAYGVNDISFDGITGNGAGVTVAIVDAYDNPDLVDSSSPAFATSDLGTYDSEFGITNLPTFSFTKVGLGGGATPTATNPDWEVEEALDVEMVHAIAPAAKIVLVEVDPTAGQSLYQGDQYAATIAPVVSDSWGGGEGSGETADDSIFTVPDVTFLFATGDSGAPGGYPAYSPDVVAVGGTSLYTDPETSQTYETGWSSTGLVGSYFGAGGGGTSQVESEPSYQEGVQDTGQRTIPDVSSNASPSTGVAVFDGSTGGWEEVGGTSEACPTWAGYIAIADQGRALAGAAPLTGFNQTLPALYSIPYTDYNDVTVGNNASDNPFTNVVLEGVDDPGYKAGDGYDEVTGLGSPKANLLVPALASYGIADKLVVTTEPPSSVVSGDSFGLTVSVEDEYGNVDTSYNGTATLTLSSNPGDATFAPVTASFVNGQAAFTGLSLSPVAQGYQFHISGDAFSTTTSAFGVVTNPMPGSGSLYPSTTDASLRAAITAADSNSFSSDTIYLEAGTYSLTDKALGQLVLEDTASGVPNKTITIVGQGAGSTIIEPEDDAGFATRDFEIISTPGAAVTVIFQDLTIAGGYAENGGALGGTAALGGGLLIDGGQVTLSNVDLTDDEAGGAEGAVGAGGGKGDGAGEAGGNGGAALGGAFYVAGGSLDLRNTVISQDVARGGEGGSGGHGGAEFGHGGAGGVGGTAAGAGGFLASGSISGSNNQFLSNLALGGTGGSGGWGGTGAADVAGGTGGAGGNGGAAFSAGLFVQSGSVTLGSTSFDDGYAKGGNGAYAGIGGVTRPFTSDAFSILFGLDDGSPGNGGYAGGGGLFMSGGAVALSGGSAATNAALGGTGATSANLIYFGTTFSRGTPFGSPGYSLGGGIYVGTGSLSLSGFTVARDVADYGGGLANAPSGSVLANTAEFSGNLAYYGGGIYNFGTFQLDGGVVAINTGIDGGGGIFNEGNLDLTGASIINNVASSGRGGGIENSYSASASGSILTAGHVHLSDVDVSGNTAETRGGGIYSGQGSLTIVGNDNVIDDNTVTESAGGSSVTVGFGGGVDVQGGTGTISGATISGNSSEFGGGVFVYNGTVTISNDTISDNSAEIGGGVHNGIHNQGSVTIDDVTITGNTAGDIGGGINNRGPLTVNDSTISDNVAADGGGGILNIGTLTLSGDTISDNTAGTDGGGLDNSSGSATISDSTLDGDVATGIKTGNTIDGGLGGAIYNDTTIKITGTTLSQDTAVYGGGLYNDDGAKATVNGVTISSDLANKGDGGGIFNRGSLSITGGSLTGDDATGNSAAGSGLGGALYLSGGKLTIAGTANNLYDIGDDSAAGGGGIYLTSGTLTLSLVQLAHDTASVTGGAIINLGTLVISNSVFSDDAAVSGDGGAIENSEKLTITSTTFSGDSAGLEGGSIRSLSPGVVSISSSTIGQSKASTGGDIWNSGTLSITTSTVSGGSASVSGGGIDDTATSTLNLSNSTIADDSSVSGGGIYTAGTLTAVNATIADNDGTTGSGLDVAAGTTTLYNTIVDGDQGGNDVAGTLAAASSYNLFGTGANALTGTNSNLVGVTSPDLGSLANNGGPTETVALLIGSPAIDGGANSIAGQTVPTLDQRGAIRASTEYNSGTQVDIGAYEASSGYLISSTADSSAAAGTLRSGLNWAASSTNDNPENLANPLPDSLVFNTAGVFASPQTITLTHGPLVIPTTEAVAIVRTGGGMVTISGGGLSQVIEVPTGATLTVEGVTITDGVGNVGGGIESDGTLSLINTSLEGNSAGTGGGLSSTGKLSISGGTISDNSAANGGGVESVGSLQLSDATIEGNSASADGGGIDYSGGPGGKLTITGSTFTDNSATNGGGLFLFDGTVSITGGTFSGNTAKNGVGGGLFDDLATVTITGTALTGNKSTTQNGGAIEVSGGTLTALELTLENNSAAYGGAIANGGNTTIDASNITGNTASISGGGISNTGTLSLESSTVASNKAVGSGLGGGLANSGVLTVDDSTLSGNSGVSGGGIANSSGTASLTNTTIAGNTATTGGGIDNDLGTLTTVNATIADNSAGSSGSGGGLYTTNNGATLYNTIVDLNTSSGGVNIVGTLSTNSTSNLINNANPDLGTLGNNGGPTETIALLTGSPAIDGGDNNAPGVPTTDQRGALRGLLGINAGQTVDIGAYEASSSYAVTGTSTVDSTLSGTLRSAVGWANVSTNDNPENLADPAPNTVQISASGAYTTALSSTLGTLVLSNSVTEEAIENIGSSTATISGGGAVGVLQVDTGVTAILSNLTITGGSAASGGGIDNSGTLTLSGISVTGNSAASGGGIINTGSLTLESLTSGTSTVATTISDNTASGIGGGVDDIGTLTLEDASIAGNSADTGGGIAVGGTLTVSDASEITGNSATGTGGGIGVLDGGILNVTGSTIAGNTAASGGGISNSGTLTLNDAQIMTNAAASGYGGGLDNQQGGTATLSYSTVEGNTADFGGGGIDNSSTLSLTVSTVATNTAGADGGGISDEGGGALTVADSTLSGNSATVSGGGLAVTGDASLTNATIAGNASGSGGGVYTTGDLTLLNDTIAANSISNGGTGGGLYADQGTATLLNTIVASNIAGTNTNSNAAGSIAPTSANNLFGKGGSGGMAAVSGNLINVASPDLGALANNGGPTETIALLAGSPAIDAGANTIIGQTIPTTDQRGALRGPAGLYAGSSVDIGAYEATSSYLVTTTTDSSAIGTLRAGVGWADLSTNANPEALAAAAANHNIAPANTTVFQTSGTFATPQTITLAPTLGPITLSNPDTPVTIDGTSSNGLTLSGGGAVGVIVVASGTTADLTGLTISGGQATDGGAIDNDGALTVADSTLTGNSATDGGAIANAGTLSLESSTLNANSASADGGGIDNVTTGSLATTNDTIADNTAAEGGGIFNAGTLTVVNATIAYNVSGASGTGGGLDASAGTIVLYNTIVAENTDGSGADDVAGTLSSSSEDNLFGTGGSGGLGTGGGNQINVADQVVGLGTLSSNGGSTLTLPLLPTSPAVNGGSSSLPGTPEVDQRGALRGVGDVAPDTAIDIGAYELSTSYLVTLASDSTIPGTLRTAINWANTTGGTTPIEILFDTKGVFSVPRTITLTLGTLALTETTAPVTIDGPGASMVTISGDGSVGVFSVASDVTATFSRVTIADGSASGSGGAINNAGTLTVTDSSLADNATGAGSGAGIVNTGTLTVSGSSFSNDISAYYGGAIYNDEGTANVSNSNFVDNTAVYGLGGAIDNQAGVLTVTGSTFTGNTSFQGAAIFNRDGTASVTDSTLSDNSAYQGGAIFSDGTTASPGIMTVTDSTIADNAAFQGGGVSNNYGGTMTIVDSTLAGNSANQYGGAIDNVGTLTIISGTIAYNTVEAGAQGAGIDAYDGTTTLYDTIAVLNTIGTGTSATADDITGAVASASAYNMVGAGGLTNGVNNNIVGATSPGLASGLANNGGPTQTIALLAGSPAIGAGSETIAGVTIPTTDQIGTSRPAAKFDIGAYQSSFAPAPVLTKVAQPVATTPSPAVASVAAAAPAAVITDAAVSAPTVVSGPSPFGGRQLGSKGSHKAKKASSHTTVHHTRTVTVKVKAKTPSVRIVKKHG